MERDRCSTGEGLGEPKILKFIGVSGESPVSASAGFSKPGEEPVVGSEVADVCDLRSANSDIHP